MLKTIIKALTNCATAIPNIDNTLSILHHSITILPEEYKIKYEKNIVPLFKFFLAANFLINKIRTRNTTTSHNASYKKAG